MYTGNLTGNDCFSKHSMFQNITDFNRRKSFYEVGKQPSPPPPKSLRHDQFK